MDLMEVMRKYMSDNFLKDKGFHDPVLDLDINDDGETIVVEFSSVEEANRLLKLAFIEIIGVRCKTKRIGESLYGQENTLKSKIKNAQNMAKAYKAVIHAMDKVTKNFDGNDEIKLVLPFPISKFIKITNLVDKDSASYLKKQNFDQIFMEILKEVGKETKVTNAKIVTNSNKGIGAKPGDIFMELTSKENAEKIINIFSGKSYQNNKFKIVCVPDDTYEKHFFKIINN